jgi:hypothetical protein
MQESITSLHARLQEERGKLIAHFFQIVRSTTYPHFIGYNEVKITSKNMAISDIPKFKTTLRASL